MNIELTPVEFADLVLNLKTMKPEVWDVVTTDSDDLLEERLQTEYSSIIESVRNMVHYSQTKKKMTKFSEMHPIHLLNVLFQTIKDTPNPKEIMDNESFQAIILNLNGAVIDYIVEKNYNKGLTGDCFQDSLDDEKKNNQ